MAWYIIWAQQDQTWLLGPRPQGQGIFQNFMIL